MGKTVITLSAADELLRDRFELSRVLVIAPLKPAVETWPAELSKWEHLKGLEYSLVVGSEKQRIAALEKDAEIYIIKKLPVPSFNEQASK